MHRKIRATIVMAALLGAPALPTRGAGPALADDAFPSSVVKSFAPEPGEALEHPTFYDALDKARAELSRGRYRAALYASFTLPAQTPAVEVARLRAEALAALGQTDAAIEVLDRLPDAPPEVGLLRGRILLDAGRSSDAIAVLRRVTEAEPEWALARVELARACEAVGDFNAARDAYAWFTQPPRDYVKRFREKGAIDFEDAAELAAAAAAVDRWATLTGAYRQRKDLHQTVLEMLVAAYDLVDATYWPAHLETARFLAAHSKTQEAAEELGAALRANPNYRGALALAADLAVEGRDLAKLSLIVKQLRDVDARSGVADRYESASALLQRQFDRALTLARRAVERRPADLDALAHLAMAYAIRNEPERRDEVLARIAVIDPDDARADAVIGTFSAMFYDSAGAVRHLERAVERAPWWVQPRHELGDAYLSEGDEDRARIALDAAYEVDPFNVKTVNYLRVLDDLAKFHVVETQHFIFKYAAIDDPIVPLYIGPYMDSAYDELTALFAFAPDRKPIVEVFPDAQSFSVRTAGVVGLESFGASQGRVMTVVAPRAGETLGPFNWARVMRHEFVHTLNLLQTHGRVPRWLTEGLAVWQEHVPYRFAWVPKEMHKRVTSGKLMTPAMMADALLRPRGNDGEVAYMTSFWLVQFIDETIGRPAILKILDGYKRGLSEDAVFREATGLEMSQLHEQFELWAKKKVEGWGYDEATAKQADALAEEAAKLTAAGDHEPAARKWEEVLKLQPMNPLPRRRLAGLYLRLNRPLQAAAHLEAIIGLELQDNRLARRVAEIHRDAGEMNRALAFARTSVQINPYDPIAHDLLGELYEKTGEAALARQEREVAALLRQRAEQTRGARGKAGS